MDKEAPRRCCNNIKEGEMSISPRKARICPSKAYRAAAVKQGRRFDAGVPQECGMMGQSLNARYTIVPQTLLRIGLLSHADSGPCVMKSARVAGNASLATAQGNLMSRQILLQECRRTIICDVLCRVEIGCEHWRSRGANCANWVSR